MLKGLDPILPDRPRVLIVGTFPGEASREARKYYWHPRNAFWPIMAVLTGGPLPDDYEARLQVLRDHGIAVWDVFDRCSRAPGTGSDDGGIRDPRPNRIPELLRAHPGLRVGFNGKNAPRFYRRYIGPLPSPHVILPSTSPAAARLTVAQKTALWQERLGFRPVLPNRR